MLKVIAISKEKTHTFYSYRIVEAKRPGSGIRYPVIIRSTTTYKIPTQYEKGN